MDSQKGWSRAQRDVVIASFFGWMLDAFDFFLVVFVLKRMDADFGVTPGSTTYALFLTLAMRPLGALLFGRLADRIGRRPVLMLSVLSYSVVEFASAFAPSLSVFLVLRALYGIAMGGEWGVGAALAFESVPVASRGLLSGILQSGYPCGYLLAAVVFGLFFDQLGWRGMFMVGAAPALLVLYIRSRVPESPAWQRSATAAAAAARVGLLQQLRQHWPLVLYAVLMMAAFNFFSHGTQDLYPTFLSGQRGFVTATVSRIAIIYNLGAICGGLTFGVLSNRLGRRRTIALAALLSLPAMPLWVYGGSASVLAASAFALQFMVQGAWGVVPAHLNELAPPAMRATFPGVVYQLGNLLASYNAPLQQWLARRHGSVEHPDYAWGLIWVCGTVAIVLALLAIAGPEKHSVDFERQMT